VIRISTVSTQPPKYPARMPTLPPTTIATTAAAKPTVSDIRPPSISSDSMSTPPSSKPNGWRSDGGS
jgi:hypothetical protein